MSDPFFEQGSRLLTPQRLRVRPRRRAEARRAIAELPDARRARNEARVGRDDGDGRPGTVDEVAQIVGHEVRDTDLLGVAPERHALARAARRRLRELPEGDRPPRPAHRQLRLPRPAAHLGRRGLLSDARRRRRLAEAAGGVAPGRQLARRTVRPVAPTKPATELASCKSQGSRHKAQGTTPGSVTLAPCDLALCLVPCSQSWTVLDGRE